jgi:hypothetical protein
MQELLIGGVIIGIVGGGIMAYNYYREYKRQQYYAEMKKLMFEIAMYYVAINGMIDLNAIKNACEALPNLKNSVPEILNKILNNIQPINQQFMNQSQMPHPFIPQSFMPQSIYQSKTACPIAFANLPGWAKKRHNCNMAEYFVDNDANCPDCPDCPDMTKVGSKKKSCILEPINIVI